MSSTKRRSSNAGWPSTAALRVINEELGRNLHSRQKLWENCGSPLATHFSWLVLIQCRQHPYHVIRNALSTQCIPKSSTHTDQTSISCIVALPRNKWALSMRLSSRYSERNPCCSSGWWVSSVCSIQLRINCSRTSYSKRLIWSEVRMPTRQPFLGREPMRKQVWKEHGYAVQNFTKSSTSTIHCSAFAAMSFQSYQCLIRENCSNLFA